MTPLPKHIREKIKAKAEEKYPSELDVMFLSHPPAREAYLAGAKALWSMMQASDCDTAKIWYDNEMLKVRLAEVVAEVDHLNRQLADAMSGCCDCPMFKERGMRIQELEDARDTLKLAMHQAAFGESARMIANLKYELNLSESKRKVAETQAVDQAERIQELEAEVKRQLNRAFEWHMSAVHWYRRVTGEVTPLDFCAAKVEMRHKESDGTDGKEN
jgi:hypothetical protein